MDPICCWSFSRDLVSVTTRSLCLLSLPSPGLRSPRYSCCSSVKDQSDDASKHTCTSYRMLQSQWLQPQRTTYRTIHTSLVHRTQLPHAHRPPTSTVLQPQTRLWPHIPRATINPFFGFLYSDVGTDLRLRCGTSNLPRSEEHFGDAIQAPS